MTQSNTKRLVAFGEALWDCLPNGIFLGGAPLNVAYHAARLGAKSFAASSVGRDFLGDQVIVRAEYGGVDTRLLKQHSYLSTGVSIASLDDGGNASYEIREPVAWDDIVLDESDVELVDAADVLVYGTLAARSEKNRRVLGELLTSSVGTKICDVNLRAPFDSRDLALELASLADVLKINEEELEVLCGVKGLGMEDALRQCQDITGVDVICVTMGGKGAALWRDGVVSYCASGEVKVADTIGAGDSFTAAFAVSMMEGRAMSDCLSRAVRLGAFVASKSGAQPDYDPAEVFAGL